VDTFYSVAYHELQPTTSSNLQS